MKVALQQLPQHLTKNLSPLYIISGDEILLIQETLDQIRQAATTQGFHEIIRIPAESDWAATFHTHATSYSLLADKRILELDLTTVKLNATSGKILQQYAEQPSPDILILLRANKLDTKTEQTLWFKALEKVGVFIPVWPIAIDQLPAWLIQRAKKINLTLTSSAAELLAQRSEGNLLAAAQELEKLSLLQPTQAIDAETLQNTLSDEAHFDVYALVNSTCAGNNKRTLRILRALAAEDTEPTLIVWALARELRTLTEMSKQLQQGQTLNTLYAKHRIWEKRRPCVRAFLQRNNLTKCWEMLRQAAHIDRFIKGAEMGDIWVEMERWILTI